MNYQLTDSNQRLEEENKDRNFFIDLSDLMTPNLPLIKMKSWVPQVAAKMLKAVILDKKLRLDPLITDGEAIDFIFDTTFKLFFGIGHFKHAKKENEIIMAGQIKCRNGLVYYINNWSGYFETEDNQFINFVKEFRKLDFVTPDLQVELYNFK
jgi:hypothetical protein